MKPTAKAKSKSDNPLSELIDDEVFNTLKKYKLLDEKAIRDYKIRQMYKDMRREMSAGEAKKFLIDYRKRKNNYLGQD